jgi:murein DD-endopeptidase MepM/ murein hydrolase activator NlpD
MGTARTRVVILALTTIMLASILWILKYRSNTRAIETYQPSSRPTFAPSGGTIATSPAKEASPPIAPSPESVLAASPFASPEETRETPTPTPTQDSSFVGRLNLIVPVAGVRPEQLIDTFKDARSEGRVHDAIDIPAPAGTPVLAAADGEIIKLFPSEKGGTTIYQLSMDKKLVFYYAHLQRYAEGIAVGNHVRQGDVIAYVGDTGNAGAGNYHLHFSISIVADPKRYWEGTNINPYPLLHR